MNQQISTQYENYQELLLDLDIFGRLSSTKQLDLNEYEELFYEEFKQQKPFPTMESKRYELSRIVDSSYRVEYIRQIELRENERLVDFNEESTDEKRSLGDIDVSDDLKNLFHYENQVHDRDREEIIKKYSLENGELLQGVRPEKLMGTIQEDKSLVLDDTEIENLGAEERQFHDESFEPVEEDIEQEDKYDGFEALLGIDDTVETEPEIEDDSETDIEDEEPDTEEEPEIEDDSETDIEDEEPETEDEEDYEPDIEEEPETEDEEDYEPDIEEEPTEEKDDFLLENDQEPLNSETIDSEETEQKNQDLSVEQLMQMLGSKLHLDADQLKQMVTQTQEPIEQEPVEQKPVEDKSVEQEENGLEDFFSGTDEDDFFVENKPKEQAKELEQSKEQVAPKESEELQEQAKPTEPIDRSSEPTDLRAFIRKHPRCDYDFATQYFTPKQIAMEIKKGRIIKKGNMLKI